MRFFLCCLLTTLPMMQARQPVAGRPVDDVLADYIKAVGGLEAVDRFSSREIVVDVHHGKDLILYWQKPNQVLAVSKRERTGFDGAHAWTMSAKNKIRKLVHGAELPLEMEANPLRWVHLKELYEDLEPGASEEIDGKKMDVIVAPNKIAATKLYFDSTTHLLSKVEEKGEISVYFTTTVEYSDYQEVDGVRMPFQILHQSGEPDARAEELHFKKVTHNLKLQTEMFAKPMPGAVVLGGKR